MQSSVYIMSNNTRGTLYIGVTSVGLTQNRPSGVIPPSLTFVMSSSVCLAGTILRKSYSDLIKRTWQHKEFFVDGFCEKFKLKNLVWYEIHEDIAEAIKREKQLKKWMRMWKIHLIEQSNPTWGDLYPGLLR